MFEYNFFDACGIRELDGERSVCSAAQAGIEGVIGVRPDLAWAAYRARVLRYDGDSWTQFGPALGQGIFAHAIWADEERILVGTGSGVYESDTDRANFRGPTSDREIWSLTRSGRDTFVGSDDGEVLRRRGSGDWTAIWREEHDCGEDRGLVNRMWSAEGEVYFKTARSWVRWDDDEATTLETLDCGDRELFLDVSGTGPERSFAVRTRSNVECGDVEVLWFDGQRIRSI
jgi:hypothetical protein